MRVIVNEKLVTKRSTAARNATTIGLVLLVLTVILSFRPGYVLAAYGVLLISFVLLGWGAGRGARWLQEPRPDQRVAKALKGLDNKYQLYSFLLPAEQVLLCPTGLFVLLLKLTDGKIKCHGEKWHRKFTFWHIFLWLAEERLGNPSKRANAEAQKLRRFVTNRLPEADILIQPVIVFVDPKAELEVVEPTVPAMLLSELKAYLRDAKTALPQKTYQALTQLFNEQAI
jgi:hypothetical protein